MTDTIRDKIRKLLALADGQANEHESARAYELASRLMMEHGIERDQLGARVDKAKLKYSDWFDMDHKWELYCAHAAAALYGVQVLVRRGQQQQFHFVGRTDNVDAAQDTCAFILLQVEALYKVHLPKGLSQRERAAYRHDFKFSCASRVLKRCQDIVNGIGASKNAIVVHRDELKKEIDAFVGPTRVAKSRAVATKGSRGLIDGIVAGDKVDVNRKVASSRSSASSSQSLRLF